MPGRNGSGEQLLRDLLPRIGVKLVVLRPFNHIGPGQDERFVVASFAGQIARIEAGLVPPCLEVGNLSSYRDFLDVADVAAAYADLIGRAESLPDGSVFNISSGQPRTIASVLEDLRARARVPFEIRVAPERVRPAEIPLAAGDAGLPARRHRLGAAGPLGRLPDAGAGRRARAAGGVARRGA